MIYIGIDPGLQGGIGFIVHNSVMFADMPIEGKIVDSIQLKNIFNNFHDQKVFLLIEELIAMPKQNVKSTLTQGINWGMVIATAKLCSNFIIATIHPKTWKAYYKLNSDKDNSIKLVKTVFPELKDNPDLTDGPAEALLLAYYAKQFYPLASKTDLSAFFKII